MTLEELRVKWKPVLNDNFITYSYRAELCERELFPVLREMDYVGFCTYERDPYIIYNFTRESALYTLDKIVNPSPYNFFALI